MEPLSPLRRHTGIAVPLLRSNIDTDAIIPSREMKRVSKHGLGEGLFAAWRYTLPGSREEDPSFILNDPAYRGASILLAGANFGCGSSREHAVWALHEYGFRVIIAPSFGSIFYSNCVRNGILPVELDEAAIARLADAVAEDPVGRPLTVDLEAGQVLDPEGRALGFAINPGHRRMLMEGLDVIGLTLERAADIDAFEQADRQRRPWIHR
jgi:3-isopropylmalate/(R)-2-methylmalate dehydratase small subunit